MDYTLAGKNLQAPIRLRRSPGARAGRNICGPYTGRERNGRNWAGENNGKRKERL